MAPVDRRVRLWSWVVERQGSIASKSEAVVVAMQERGTPDNALTNHVFGKVSAGLRVSDTTIPGPAGDLPVRIYRPASANVGPWPLVVFFHGGGWVVGDLRMGDWMCGNVAATVGAVVVSVQYRLAPRHRFPAAVDDCYAAVLWAAEHATELGAGGPIGVMGESAGGNLSAVICLLARDRGGPAISHQALLYPPTDLPSVASANATNALIINQAEMNAYLRHYLGDADPADPRASPLLASDHTKLPPALIQVAEHDPLREQGIRYAAALRSAGVPVRLTDYVGMPHGFLNFPGICRSAPQAIAEICAEQTSALATYRVKTFDRRRLISSATTPWCWAAEAVHGSHDYAGTGRGNALLRRAPSAAAWRRCHLLCHWLQDHLPSNGRSLVPGEPEFGMTMVP